MDDRHANRSPRQRNRGHGRSRSQPVQRHPHPGGGAIYVFPERGIVYVDCEGNGYKIDLDQINAVSLTEILRSATDSEIVERIEPFSKPVIVTMSH